MTGAPKNPCWVRFVLPLRTLTNGVSGLPDQSGFDCSVKTRVPSGAQP